MGRDGVPNLAAMGRYSIDRTVEEYLRKVWSGAPPEAAG
jgi:glucan phosphorylase